MPTAEIVVCEHAGRLLRVFVASGDAAAWVDRVALTYAEFYRIDTAGVRSMVVRPNYDFAEVAAYLRSYGASIEKEPTP